MWRKEGRGSSVHCCEVQQSHTKKENFCNVLVEASERVVNVAGVAARRGGQDRGGEGEGVDRIRSVPCSRPRVVLSEVNAAQG